MGIDVGLARRLGTQEKRNLYFAGGANIATTKIVMKLPQQIKLQDDSVRVHLVGPGFGESALIIIGQKIAIGIDCCQSLVQQRKDKPSYLDEQISGMGPDPYLCWIITHFHLDHFESFEKVLDVYENELKSIVVPSGYTAGDFDTARLHYENKLATRREAPGGQLADVAVEEVEMIQRALTRKSLRFIVSDSSSKQHWFSTQLVLPNRKRIPLVVDYYGASYHDLRRLKGQAVSKLMKAKTAAATAATPEKKLKRGQATANQGSYILHVVAGRFEGIFPGDAHSSRTEEILSHRGQSDAEIFCLKVSHHGAADGTSQELLDQLSRTTTRASERHALIAPFNSNELPKSKIRDLLRRHKFSTHLCGSPDDSPAVSKIKNELQPAMTNSVEKSVGYGENAIAMSFKL